MLSNISRDSPNWREESESLRDIILGTSLRESLKWGKPCYCHNGRNVVILQPFKKCLALMFFKGTLLSDAKGILVDNGPNSQSARRLEFASLQDIIKARSTIKAYLQEAIALEESGKTVLYKKKPEPVPSELRVALEKQPKLKRAFAALTPGRQRAYILHIAGAKQTATRVARIKKCIPGILAGKGLNER